MGRQSGTPGEHSEHSDSEHSERTGGRGVRITLEARPERRLVRPTGSKRHVVFSLRVGELAQRLERRPLTLGLVLDRSGSMQGEKLRAAKQVVAAIVRGMDERDRVALVIFDDKIDVLQPMATVTSAVKRAIDGELGHVEARGSTALHEGWLRGCQAIAGNEAAPADRAVARCWLFTDGQANVGEADPERIATEAAGIRDNAGIGTSTFGFGEDYNEQLLGPMAVAGGGQFHHLETAHDLARTFQGERDDLFAVAAMRVRLEIEMAPGMTGELISAFRRSGAAEQASTWSVDLGDLLASEERHVVVRFGFPSDDRAYSYTVRARLVWTDDSGERTGAWQEVSFTHGSQDACDDEPRDPLAMHLIGLAYADQAQQRAVELSNAGDNRGAEELLRKVARRIAEYAGDDTELLGAIAQLEELAAHQSAWAHSSLMKKGMYSTSQRHSRSQKDYRSDV